MVIMRVCGYVIYVIHYAVLVLEYQLTAQVVTVDYLLSITLVFVIVVNILVAVYAMLVIPDVSNVMVFLLSALIAMLLNLLLLLEMIVSVIRVVIRIMLL
jgi:hypothetical protein